MSVASEFDIQRQLITNAYNKLDDLGIDSTGIDKNINNIAEMLEEVYEDYPKVPGQGTELTLDGTKAGKLSLDIKGNSVQDGTPTPDSPVEIYSAGDENLFDGEITTGSVINSSGGLSPTALGWYSNNYYSVKPNTEYILTYNSTDFTFGMRIAQYIANKTFSTRPVTYTSPYTFTTGNDIYFVRLSGGTADSNIQLKETVGSISEKIVNKNLFDYENSTVTAFFGTNATKVENGFLGGWGYYVTFPKPIPAGTYNISLKVSNKDNSDGALIYIQDINNTTISGSNTYIGTEGNKTKTFTSTEQIKRLKIDNGKESVTTLIYDIQIEKGSTATTYVAHQEQTYTIPVQQPMRSIGTVRDEFIQDTNGNYFERHNIVIIDLNGSYSVSSKRTNTILFLRQNTNKKIGIYPYMSNCFTNVGFSNINNDEEFISDGAGYNTRCYISINKTKLNNYSDDLTNAQLVTLLNNWLQENEAIAIYPLQTPTDLPCTEEQISIFENLPKSYNEQTNIYSLDVTPAYVEAKALKGE